MASRMLRPKREPLDLFHELADAGLVEQWIRVKDFQVYWRLTPKGEKNKSLKDFMRQNGMG